MQILVISYNLQLALISHVTLIQLISVSIYTSHHQSYFSNSYFPRTFKNWNNLPSEIKNSSTIAQFKNLINKFYLDKLSLKSAAIILSTFFVFFVFFLYSVT